MAQIRIWEITRPKRQGMGFAFELISDGERISCWSSEFTLEEFHERIHRAKEQQIGGTVVRMRKC